MENIDNLYLSIAQNIIQNSSDSWDIAEVNVEVFDDALKLKGGHYKNEMFTSFKFRNFDRKIIKDFENIHLITTENPDNNWNRAKFTLEPTGKFNIEFEWDQALADEIERLNNE
ncbi:DUF600 family protein [Shewanella sp. VB17]|uniref:immunity protein YezG family protein n=1 Tax=Shewanella sp. VB17 TaxID=2739432 RepID=UPI001563A2AD|nr:immunity protein YezG family protein [Shewanella sp. VB17]NRD74006.1 DUF600 family protein [Shewanella sp. VB17]